MGVVIHPNLNQLDIAEKFVFDGASKKNSCSYPHHNIDTAVSQPYNMLRLLRVVEEMEDTFVITLKHEYNVMKDMLNIVSIGISDSWIQVFTLLTCM